MMDFEEFKKRVAMEIEIGPGAEGREVEIREILQNNGVRKFAVAVHIPGENASPLVYLEKHYESFRRGKSFPAVVQEIRKECSRHRLPEGLEALSAFACWGQVKEMLGIKAINYKENQELLEALPHRRFLDLAAVYHCAVELEGGSGGLPWSPKAICVCGGSRRGNWSGMPMPATGGAAWRKSKAWLKLSKS